ncbi:hypothetical protein [Virgibacillus halodenitrificans]|uniref:hypothetical protein n=1 Tax=Virgibacillus halodenitrificans TaxID=1482 RepID=UPI000EF4D466|nr:hypothetical protein [Virgibacillus halodenitrificans]
MKLSNKIKIGAAASVVALTLAGCGTSPKEDFSSAYKNLAESKSYEYNTDIDLSVVENTIADLEIKQAIDLMDSIQISARGLVDSQKQQTEQDFNFKASMSPIELSLDLSLFSDLKEGTNYVKAADFLDLMNNIGTLSGFPLNFTVPEDLHDAIIEIPTPETILTEQQTEKISESFTNKFNYFLSDLSEENFTKENNDVYTLKFEGEKLKSIFTETIEEYLSVVGGDAVTLEELEKAITIGEVVVVSTIEDGNIAEEEITLPLEVKRTTGETIDLEVVVKVKYKLHNEPVEFTFDPEKDTLLSKEEFSETITNNLFPNVK